MIRMHTVGVFMVLALMWGVPTSSAQDHDALLKRDVEQRFDVLPLREGLALHPKTPMGGVLSVEISGGTIALDGQPATGAELRARLGADADRVLQLSYLSDAARRALFFAPSPASPAPATASVPPPAPATPDIVEVPGAPDVPSRRRRSGLDRRNGDRVRVGGGVVVEAGEVVDGDVVSVAGAVTVDGEVRGDVVAVGGGVTLGPSALVGGDVTAVGGPVRRDPGAQVHGKVQEVGLGGIDFGRWTWRRNPVGVWWRSTLGSAFALVGTLVRVAVLCLLAALVVLLGRDYMERAGQIAATSAITAAGVGFLAQVCFLPVLVITVVVLVMTVVGIPLLLVLPFAVLGVALIALVGFTGVAHYVGQSVSRRFGWAEQGPYTLTVAGVLLLMLPIVLSRIASLGGGVLFPLAAALGVAGIVIEYLAWTVGFGAVVLMRVRRRLDSRTSVPGPAV